MKIGILGGAFNPVHKGHIRIAQDALQSCHLDKLFFVPTYKSPFKKNKLAPAHHRVNMIKLHLEPNMEVSDFEIKRRGISYTITTFNFFKKQYPQATIYIIIGSDQLHKLPKWKDVDQLAQGAHFVVYRRDKPFSKINLKKYNCTLLNNVFFQESSTAVRHGHFLDITKEVACYIGQNHLYINDLLAAMLSPTRRQHSLAAASFAVQLAKGINYDAKQAWVAAVFHDITKDWTNAQHHAFLKQQGVNGEHIPNYQLHSLTGSVWIDKVYRIQDPEIVAAIKHHTALNDKLTRLDKVVYAADKLCQGRKYAGVQADRRLILADFEQGFRRVVQKTYAHLKVSRPLTTKQARIYKEWSSW